MMLAVAQPNQNYALLQGIRPYACDLINTSDFSSVLETAVVARTRKACFCLTETESNYVSVLL